MASKYKHDCIHCRPFAQTSEADWYVCTAQSVRSVLCRYSDKPEEYESLPLRSFAVTYPMLRAALALGLRLTEDEVRAMLAHVLGHDIPIDTYQLTGRDEVGEAIVHSVLARPEES